MGLTRFLGALGLKLPESEAVALLEDLMSPLYAMSPWDAGSGGGGGGGGGGKSKVDSSVRQAVQQTLDALKNHVGVTAFARAAASVQTQAESGSRRQGHSEAVRFIVDV